MQNADTLRLCDSELIHSFSKPNSFIHGVYSVLSLYAVLLSKITVYGGQKLKGKHVFRKIEIIHGWQVVSSVAQNEILCTSAIQAVGRQCFQMGAVKISISPGLA